MRIELPGRTAVPLILLAVGCLIGLDFIAREKGNPSWLFPQRRPAPPARINLFALLEEELNRQNIAQENISHYRDPEGIAHVMIDLTEEEYRRLEPKLQAGFSRKGADIFRQQRKREGEGRYELWKIQLGGDELSVLLNLPGEPAEPARPVQAARQVALIVDDMGNSLEAIYELCALNRALTVAVLPYSPLARETARIARDNNLEVILHLPLESLNNEYDNTHTPGLIHTGMSEEDITRQVEESLGQVPFIKGINTHMGSKVTADPNLMNIILNQIKRHDLYFVDSRTTAESVAFHVAQKLGIPSAYRQVFLDSEFEEESIKRQLRLLFERARKQGRAVGICHPSPQTLKVLRENLHLMAEYGLEPVYASALVR